MICMTCGNEEPTDQQKKENKLREGRFCGKCWFYLGKRVMIKEDWN